MAVQLATQLVQLHSYTAAATQGDLTAQVLFIEYYGIHVVTNMALICNSIF